MAKVINPKIIDKYDHIIWEQGNTYISLRKIAWNENSPTKLDLRKYYTSKEGKETMGKGVSFNAEAADELTQTLVSTGYGNTRAIVNSLKNRKDWDDSLLEESSTEEEDNEEYIDIRQEMIS